MADNDHILSTESTPLNTTLEPNATDATTEVTSAPTDHSSNPSSEDSPRNGRCKSTMLSSTTPSSTPEARLRQPRPAQHDVLLTDPGHLRLGER